jgi:malate permease and related proteins
LGLLLVIPVIIGSAAAGVAAELRWRERAERACDRMLLVTLYVLVPPIVFFNVARLEFTVDVGVGLVLGYVAIAVAAGLAWAAGSRAGWRRPVVGTVIVCAAAGNSGYLGYPLATILLGADLLPQVVAYDALVSVPVLVVGCFAVGAAFGDEAGETVGQRMRAFFTRNPLLPAFALALVAPDALAPDVLVDASRALVFALLPTGFFAVGVYLAATSPGRFSLPRPDARITLAVALRMLAVPGLLYLLALPLIQLPPAYLLLAAMPCGLNTLVVANAYGLDRRLAAGAIAWSTALALAAAAVAIVATG